MLAESLDLRASIPIRNESNKLLVLLSQPIDGILFSLSDCTYHLVKEKEPTVKKKKKELKKIYMTFFFKNRIVYRVIGFRLAG